MKEDSSVLDVILRTFGDLQEASLLQLVCILCKIKMIWGKLLLQKTLFYPITVAKW